MIKKITTTMLLSATLFLLVTNAVHAEVKNEDGIIVSNDQVPASIKFYWDYWREIKLTKPVQAKLVHYPSDSSGQKIVTKTKIIPENTIIYAKGMRSYSPPSNSYFAITKSKNDLIYGKSTFSFTKPYWTINYNDIINFELTSNNDPISKINVKTLTSNSFTNDKWQSGYLSLANLTDGLGNNSIFSQSYSGLKRYEKLMNQDNDTDTDSSKDKKLTTQIKRVLKNNFINYKGKDITKVFKVRAYKDKTVQVKIGKHVYYASNSNILPYNTTSNNGITSLEKPTTSGIQKVVLRAGDTIYNTNYQSWNIGLSAKNGDFSKTRYYSYEFNSQNWYHNSYDGQKWHHKLLK